MESFYVIVTIPRVLLTRRSHLLFVYIDTVFLDNVGKELFLALCLDHLLFVDLNVRLEQVSILLEFLQSLQAQVNFSSLKGERISLKQIFHFLGKNNLKTGLKHPFRFKIDQLTSPSSSSSSLSLGYSTSAPLGS